VHTLRDGHAPADPPCRSERWIVPLAVALPILVLFGPVLLSDRLPAMRDAGHYYYPLFKWCAGEWGAGRVPLWNPLENCGTPVHADPTASIFYPGKLVFALPVDFSIRFKFYVVGHVALCAIAAWWLARRWHASNHAAALAALSYSCGGSVVFQHCNVVYLVGASWLPMAIGLADELLRECRPRAAVLLGVVLALMVLGGDPQAVYHVLLVAVIRAVVLLARRGSDIASARQVRRAAIRGSAWLLASAALAFVLAAVQILPSARAARDSERAQYDQPRNLYEGLSGGDLSAVGKGILGPPAAGTHHSTLYDFSVGPWRLAELLWPNCGGRMFPVHRRWFSLLPAEGRVWTPSLYMGFLPLMMALSALSWRSADLRVRWLSWIVLIFTLGSLGTYGLGWIVRQLFLLHGGSGEAFPIGDPVGGV
jgi:hypothetical protein